MAWVTDFEPAIEEGMAFRIPLSGDASRGFDKLMVLGVRLRSTPSEPSRARGA